MKKSHFRMGHSRNASKEVLRGKKKIFCRPNGNHNIYKDEVMWASGRIFKMQQFFLFMITVTMDLPRLGLCMAAPAKASAPFLG